MWRDFMQVMTLFIYPARFDTVLRSCPVFDHTHHFGHVDQFDAAGGITGIKPEMLTESIKFIRYVYLSSHLIQKPRTSSKKQATCQLMQLRILNI
jgi:hypothetical protein